MDYSKFIDDILAKEAGFVDNPDDNGGPTNFGITEAVARKYGWQSRMEDLTEDFARMIYERRYIIDPGFDKIATLSEKIAAELIDTGVNMGPHKASEFLQRLLNALNNKGSRYADMLVDGYVGNVTIENLQKFLRWRGKDGETVLYRGLNGLQTTRYLSIAEGDKSQETFFFGWLLNRVN